MINSLRVSEANNAATCGMLESDQSTEIHVNFANGQEDAAIQALDVAYARIRAMLTNNSKETQ